jgi:SAM-dependent methyltransferase
MTESSSQMDEMFASRFFKTSDPVIKKMIVDIPAVWWSRFYEYEWARRFCQPDDVVLDAACGICHPFKFFISDICRQVYACDIDSRISVPSEILSDIAAAFGTQAALGFPVVYLSRVHLERASILRLPHKADVFNKVFCISALEHLSAYDVSLALQEFRRVLKDNGWLIITFDVPGLDPEFMVATVADLGFKFIGSIETRKPEKAIWSDRCQLNCFRAILAKTSGF